MQIFSKKMLPMTSGFTGQVNKVGLFSQRTSAFATAGQSSLLSNRHEYAYLS